MADAHVALEGEHVALLEHIAHQTGVLAQKELTFMTGHDARGILSAVLQHDQGIVDLLVDRRMPDDSDDSAHENWPSGRLEAAGWPIVQPAFKLADGRGRARTALGSTIRPSRV